MSASFLLTSGQDIYQEIDLEEFAEKMFATQSEDVNYEELYEQMFQWYLRPLDLNKASEEELRSLYLLSNKQITSFLEYRNENGDLLSIYELQVIPDFDRSTIIKLLPFVKIIETVPSGKIRKNFLVIRSAQTLEDKEGFVNEKFTGSALKLYGRINMQLRNDIGIGLTTEKDAGEPLLWQPKKNFYGLDFYSGHIQIKNKGWLKNLVVGDYKPQFGQGLVTGAGFFLGKGAQTVSTVRKSNLGFRPYTSLVETGFFRGIAASSTFGKFDISSFVSYRKLDGLLDPDSITNELPFILSLNTNGFHRTTNEISKKSQVTEMVLGGNLTYHWNPRSHSGITFTGSKFDGIIYPPIRYYNQHYFRGGRNFTIGTFTNYSWQNFNIFGEGAISQSGGIGAVFGFITSLSSAIDLSLLVRNFDKDFHSLYGAAFGETQSLMNEKGTYLGLSYTPLPQLKINGYFDKFSFPWLRYRTFSPSEGREMLIRINYEINDNNKVYAQFREEKKSLNTREDYNLYSLSDGLKRNYVINTDYGINEWVDMKSRIQYSNYDFNGKITEGIAMIQDVNINYKKFRLNTRIALFDTDDYENRQYAYEKDVLYSFSIPAYYGIGVRSMILLKYTILSNLDMWLRYARTSYRDREVIGSGINRINGNRRTDINVQMRYTF